MAPSTTKTNERDGPPPLKVPRGWFGQKGREERQRKQEEEAKRQAEDKRRQQEKALEEDRRYLEDLRRAKRTGDFSTVEAKKKTKHSHEEDGRPATVERQQNGRGSRQEKQQQQQHQNQSAVKKEEYERLRLKHYGPDLSKSTFVPKKKRARADDFKFEWDASEDTRTAQHLADIEAEKQRARQYEHRLTTKNTFNMHSDEPERELRALMEADAVRARDPEQGEARAAEIMRSYYRGLAERNRPLHNIRPWQERALGEMRERDWRVFKEDFGIATKGGSIPNPLRTWRESALPPRLLDVVEAVGYAEPTPIQRAAIPIALQGRDLIGIAKTGSGKTAAFLLPLLVYLQTLPPLLSQAARDDGPYALILAPTRELAQQIEAEARKLAAPFGYRVVSIVGGHALEEQAFALSNGAEIVVATPGRLVDCIERRLLVLAQCCYVILDEADRMIDMGFEEPLNKILDAMPTSNEKPDSDAAEDGQAMTAGRVALALGGGKILPYRQTMMYTATMPPVVERIAKRYLRRPAIVTVGNSGEAVDTVEQRVEFVAGEDRRKARLREILQSGQYRPPIIVFVNIKRNCEMVARDVRAAGRNPVTLHGSKTQEQREAALDKLRAGQADVLVATDLAGRGIDVADVSLVVNFNMTSSIEQYTHRVGRTGRAGKSGIAITFLGPEDNDVLYDLRQMIAKSAISKVPDELRRHEAAQQKPGKSGGGRNNDKFV